MIRSTRLATTGTKLRQKSETKRPTDSGSRSQIDIRYRQDVRGLGHQRPGERDIVKHVDPGLRRQPAEQRHFRDGPGVGPSEPRVRDHARLVQPRFAA